MKEIDIDYNGLFRHLEDLRKVLLVTTGRTGSDFFQSLLDGHSEILQFTGMWKHHWWWKQAKCKENLPDLINEFIWYTCSFTFCNHIAKFKSCYNKQERWGQLGANKNESFEVDMDTFKNHMLNILTDKESNSKNFFLAVNLAYGLTTGVDIKKTKIIFYHIHHFERLKDFKEDFPDFDIICTVREPRNTLVSGIEHWKKYDINTYNSRFFYQLLKRIFEESEPILQDTGNIKTLKLEDLHLFSKETLSEFCQMYNLELENCMFESSYHGKKWWGDVLSGKYLDGFNKDINERKWRDKLFFYDNLLIEFILEDRLRHYGYFIENKISRIYLILIWFLVFLPMKYELKILAYNFRSNRTANAKLLVLCKGWGFYILRILLYFKFILKKVTKKIFLADFFIQEKYR
ncbi:MAG: sulfotransferase [Candidatus Omnitrophota bacterium]|nr:MAG: sulfotransferase [Candidatus Omnitrophota bacterium]